MTVDIEDYLEHVGVKGMKWGVRRAQTHKQSGAEKAVNRKLRAAGNKFREMTPEQKAKAKKIAKASAVGAVVVGSAIAAAYLHKNGKMPLRMPTKKSDKVKVDNFGKDMVKLLAQHKDTVAKTTARGNIAFMPRAIPMGPATSARPKSRSSSSSFIKDFDARNKAFLDDWDRELRRKEADLGYIYRGPGFEGR